ncbi:hypothetical protein B0H11DRAFT_1973221 [Mycena galericulata]|nr:hypothetical protein B0H11DRAFT_1973221 [Mycena galericulata]
MIVLARGPVEKRVACGARSSSRERRVGRGGVLRAVGMDGAAGTWMGLTHACAARYGAREGRSVRGCVLGRVRARRSRRVLLLSPELRVAPVVFELEEDEPLTATATVDTIAELARTVCAGPGRDEWLRRWGTQKVMTEAEVGSCFDIYACAVHGVRSSSRTFIEAATN